MGFADDYEKALEKLEDRLYMRSDRAGQGDKFSEAPPDQAFLERLNKQRSIRKLDEIRTRNQMAVESAKWIREENRREEERLKALKLTLELRALFNLSEDLEWITANRVRCLINNGAKTYSTGKKGISLLVTEDGKTYLYRGHTATGGRIAPSAGKKKKVRYSWSKVNGVPREDKE